jgi:uncharacterized membrane protein YedE/YeeE
MNATSMPANGAATPRRPSRALPLLVAGLSGLVFGWGLMLSGMANPAKVLGFLDITGRWDPSLALVMGGAIAVALPAFVWVRGRQASVLGEPLPAPPAQGIDRRLVGGSLLFGAGWGLAGYCPGPALVAVGMGQGSAVLLVLGMLAGMAVVELLDRRQSAPPA